MGGLLKFLKRYRVALGLAALATWWTLWVLPVYLQIGTRRVVDFGIWVTCVAWLAVVVRVLITSNSKE